jgi:hypothetical protein
MKRLMIALAAALVLMPVGAGREANASQVSVVEAFFAQTKTTVHVSVSRGSSTRLDTLIDEDHDTKYEDLDDAFTVAFSVHSGALVIRGSFGNVPFEKKFHIRDMRGFVHAGPYMIDWELA